MLFTKKWWLIARNRAARSAAQGFTLTATPLITAGMAGAVQFGWMQVAIIAYGTIGMGVASLATSIARSPVHIEDRQ